MSKIFISYSHKDGEEIAELLHQRLTSCGYFVWKDSHNLKIGVDFPGGISQALEETGQFVILISPASLQSKWVNKEINMAVVAGCEILPIVFDGVTNEDTPLLIKTMNYIPMKGVNDWQALNKLVDCLDGGKDIPRVYSMSKQVDTLFEGVLLLKKSEWVTANPKEPEEVQEIAEKMWRDFLECWNMTSNLGLVPSGYAPIASAVLAFLAGKPNHFPRMYYPYLGSDQKFRVRADKFVELQKLRVFAQSA